MIDAGWTAVWLLVLGLGLSVAFLLRRAGLATTYTRDLIHVGAGVWVLGWPHWRAPWLPIGIPILVAVGLGVAPRIPGRRAARLRGTLAAGDETWSGVALYAASFAALSAAAFLDRPFPAGGALLALALGDGLGGAAGRRFGRHFFRAPGGKRKSLEGSLTVALGAAAGVSLAARVLGPPAPPSLVLGAGLLAALAEAVSPRGADNVILPAATWALLRAATA